MQCSEYGTSPALRSVPSLSFIVAGELMRTFYVLFLAMLAGLYGCSSQKQMREAVLKLDDAYADKYRVAESREAAIGVMMSYLKEVDDQEQRGIRGLRYDVARAYAETRIAIIYEELRDQQNAKLFMERALGHIRKDKDDSKLSESDLRHIVTLFDERMSPVWRKKNGQQSGAANTAAPPRSP